MLKRIKLHAGKPANPFIWVGLFTVCFSQNVFTAPLYWLRLDDLRMPRPKSEDAPPVVNSRIPGNTEPVPAASTVPDTAPEIRSTAIEDNRLRIEGSYKALVIGSHTPDEANEPYTQAIGRLRLKMNYRFSPSLQAKLEHDTDMTTGNFLHTDFFKYQKNQPRQQYLSEGSTLLEKRDAYLFQSVFRGYLKYSSEETDVTVGRQRVPLGTGRFWSTLDMLNPINPLQAERDEFVGVDAILVERNINALSKVSLLYAADPARQNDRWIGQYRTHYQESDLTFTYGKYWIDQVVGVDFATQLGNTGMHGEITYTRPQVGSPYRKALVGFDYAFANTLSFSSEFYYSDRTAEDRVAQWTQNPQLALVQPLGGAYLGGAVGYDFTPILKISTYVLNNLKDKSWVLYPSLFYSPTDNVSVLAGIQVFSGRRDSEYGVASNLYFVRAQRFF